MYLKRIPVVCSEFDGGMKRVDSVQEGHHNSLPCSQMAKMFLHHVCGVANVHRSSSNFAINRLAIQRCHPGPHGCFLDLKVVFLVE